MTETLPSPPRATELVFDYIPSLHRTTLTHEYASYPLKFLHPSTMVAPGYPTAVACMLGYGGGLVGGDRTHVDVLLGANATVVMGTQATTKVYKPKTSAPRELSTQRLTVRIDADGFFAHVPDPVTCFAGALYAQHQRFILQPSASLVLVDGMTSGRHARGESWSFASFESFNEIVYEVKETTVVVVSDRVRLTDEPYDPLAARMGSMTVFGTVVLIGPKLDTMVHAILQDGARKSLAAHQLPVPAASIIRQVNQDVRVAVSRLSPSHPLLPAFSGAIVRVAATTTEAAYAYMRALLQPLEGVVGVRCLQENR